MKYESHNALITEPHYTIEAKLPYNTSRPNVLELDQVPLQAQAWMRLELEPRGTMVLHTCGNGKGWREITEGTPDASIETSAPHQLRFTCQRCSSIYLQQMDPK